MNINIAYTLFGRIKGIESIETALKDKECYNSSITNKLNEFLGFYDGLNKKPKRRDMMIGLYIFNPNYETGYSEGEKYLQRMKNKSPVKIN